MTTRRSVTLLCLGLAFLTIPAVVFAQAPACSVMVYPRFVVPDATTGTPGTGTPITVFAKLIPQSSSLPDSYAVKFRGGDGLSRGLTWLPVGDFNPANGDTGQWYGDAAAWATGTRQYYVTTTDPVYFWIQGKVLNTSTAGPDTFRVRTRLMQPGTNYDSPVYEVTALDMGTNGGWIEGNVFSDGGFSSPHQRHVVLAFKSDTIAGIYLTENNKVREGYDSTSAGYFKMAVPVGNVDSLQVRDTLNNIVASYVQTSPPWTINAGLVTSINATTTDTIPPAIAVVTMPEDTYDGSGPFTVRAVITDPSKGVIAADTLWYTDNHTDWWALTHASVYADTFEYSIPGPIPSGTVVEYFFGAWDDAANAKYDPSMYRGYQFKVLDPLPPTALNANAGDMMVQLGWAPPAEVLAYDEGSATYAWGWGPNDIFSTRFTPQHYPCRVEQAISEWYDGGAGNDSVEVHVWPDDGAGIPDLATELVPPFKVLPALSPNMTVIDLSGYNLILSSGDFHVGYVCQTPNEPMPMSDQDGPGVRTVIRIGGSWGNLTNYWDFTNRAAVTYASYTKGLALKSYRPRKTNKPLPALTGLKAVPVTDKREPVYPKLSGALAMAKNIQQFNVFRGDVSGGPYGLIGAVNHLSFTDNAVSNGNTYYYVVQAQYSTPDTFSAFSNEDTATPAAMPILLVNDAANSTEDAEDIYRAAMDGAGYSGQYTVYQVASGDVGPTAAWFANRDAVVWWTGDDLEATLYPNDEANLAAYLDAGGRLFLSADDYIYDIYNSASQGYKFNPGEFPYDYLGVDSVWQDFVSEEDFSMAGVAGNFAEGQSFLVEEENPQIIYADDLVKRAEAGIYDIFDVTAKVGEKPALAYDNGTFRTVFFALPFENAQDGTSPSTKAELMYRILNWMATGVDGNPAAEAKPMVFSLASNYPNPVRSSTTIKFATPKDTDVRLDV